MRTQHRSSVIAPAQRIILATGLIIITSSVYLYLFFNVRDLLWLGYEYNSVFNPYNFYGALMLICAVVPFLLTLTRIKTRYWIYAWIAGTVIVTVVTIILIYTDQPIWD